MSARKPAPRPHALRRLALPALLALSLIAPLPVLAQQAAAASAPGQPASGYREPAAELKAIVDAPRPPQVSLSPRRDLIALQQVPPLPSIALVAQPELKLAGLRLNPRSYSPSRFSFVTDLWLMDVATGKKAGSTACPRRCRWRRCRGRRTRNTSP